MSNAPLLGTISGSEVLFLGMLSQCCLALWLSYRCYRDEPNWQTLSMLGSLLLLGMPGFLVMRIMRSRCRAYMESFTSNTSEPEKH